MVWFKVDDKLHANTKIRKLLADDPAALALWTVAGAWSANELKDGFVPEDQLPWLMPARAEELAQKLVNARLWKRVRGGYQFHQWHADGDGTKRNPTRDEVLAERQRKADAGRKGGLVSAERRNEKKVHINKEKDSGNEEASSTHRGTTRTGPETDPKTHLASQNNPSTSQARASAPAKQLLAESLNPRPDPSRPSPSNEGERASAAVGHPPTGEPPPPKCDQHINDDDPPPCGACGRARKASEAWVAAETERQRQMTALAKSEAARQRAETARIAIDHCRTCDERGYLPNGRACQHTPEASPGAATAARELARAASRRPERTIGTSGLDALNAAVADLPPLSQPPGDPPDEPLAPVYPIRPPTLPRSPRPATNPRSTGEDPDRCDVGAERRTVPDDHVRAHPQTRHRRARPDHGG